VERISANFKYTIKDIVPKHLWSSRVTSDFASFDSICNETMVGFWQSPGVGGPATSCAIGKQIKKDNDIVAD